jgi:hypothetical protein
VVAPARHGLCIAVRSADLRGLRYPLVPVLAIAVCAMLAARRSHAATAECSADAPPRLRVRDPGRALPGHVKGNQPGPLQLKSMSWRNVPAGPASIAAALRHTARHARSVRSQAGSDAQ